MTANHPAPGHTTDPATGAAPSVVTTPPAGWPAGTLLGCAAVGCRATTYALDRHNRTPWAEHPHPWNLPAPQPHRHREARP